MSDEAVKKQLEGVCKEISEKNGWTTFHVDVGSQYPYRLQTKLDAVIEQGRGAKEQKAVWTFSESQGGEIPNQPGKHYTNRRLEKVEVDGTLDPQLAMDVGGGSSAKRSSSGGGGYQEDSPEKRASIERQTIVKAAVAALPMMAQEKPDEFFKLLNRLDDWMARGRADLPVAAAPKEEEKKEEKPPPSDEPPPPDEDDIPF